MLLKLSRVKGILHTIRSIEASFIHFFVVKSLVLFSIAVSIVKFHFFGFCFLCGPLLLLCQYKFNYERFLLKRALLHIMPFIVFMSLYFTTNLEELPFFALYLPVVFLFIYGIFNLCVSRKGNDNDIKIWFQYNSWFQIIGALGSLILILEWTSDIHFTVGAVYFVVLIIVVSILYGFVMFFLINRNEKHGFGFLESESKSFSAVRIQIEGYFENNSHFLSSCFCFDDLIRDLKQPKKVVTSVLNHEMNTNFYSFLAQKRVEEAKRLLAENNGSLTIEALLYNCGFNSKSSFNKHFKNQVGITPSEYLVTIRNEH